MSRISVAAALGAAMAFAFSGFAEEHVFRGELAKGDRVHKDRKAFVDIHEIEVEAGDLMTVSMKAEEDSGFDTYLYVTGPSGQQFSNDDDYSVGGSSVTFIVPQDGVWEIEATGYEDSQGRYKVTVNVQKIKRLLSERGTLDPDDLKLLKRGEYYDTFTMEVEAGKTYGVMAFSSEIDVFLSVHYPGGLVTTDDVGYGNQKSLVTFQPAKPGETTIVMTSNSVGEEGRYRLFAFESGVEKSAAAKKE